MQFDFRFETGPMTLLSNDLHVIPLISIIGYIVLHALVLFANLSLMHIIMFPYRHFEAFNFNPEIHDFC